MCKGPFDRGEEDPDQRFVLDSCLIDDPCCPLKRCFLYEGEYTSFGIDNCHTRIWVFLLRFLIVANVTVR